ncbi:hornerin isoform X2 [Diaphorina citri]|uniref:Hornerin isoform X2 n=1 Tax=Diaphorina citri TaxID=121845 RepID=A0A3Q0ISI6_DIACI|nr:hornerin isoform X2 [Diaphorina citri]
MRDVDRNIERSSKDKNGASNSHQNEQALDKNIASKDKSRASQLKDHKEIDKYQNTTRNDRSSPKNSQRNDRNIPRSSHQTEKSPDSVNRQNQGSSRNASRRANVQKYIDKEPLTKLESARKFKQLLDDITERNGATGSDRNKMSSSDESICDKLGQVDAHDNDNKSSERTRGGKVLDENEDKLDEGDSEGSLDSDTLLDELGKRIDSRKQHHDKNLESDRRKDDDSDRRKHEEMRMDRKKDDGMGTHNDSKPHDNSCDKVSKVRDIGPVRMLCDSELDNKVVHSGKESPSSDPSASAKAIGGKGYNSSDRQANSSTERQANNSTGGQAKNSAEGQAKNSAERQGKNSPERKGRNSIEELSQDITESPDSYRTSHPIENHSNLRSNQTEEHRPGVRINQNMDSETCSDGAQIQNMDSETRSNGAQIQNMDSETGSGDAQIQNMDTETCSDGAQIQNMDSELPPAEVAPFKREKFDSGVVDDEDTTGSVDSGGSMDSGVGTHTQPGPPGKDPYRINHDTIDYLRRWLPDNSGRQTLGELFGDGSVRFGASGRAGQSSSQNSQSETRESSRDKPGENRESGESSGSRASGQDSRPCSGKSGSQGPKGSQLGAKGSQSGARQGRTEMSGPDDSPYPTYAELQRIKRNALNSDRDISGRSREEPNENDKTRVKNDREWNVEGGNLQKETSDETNVSGDARKSTNDSSQAQSPNASPKDHRMHGSDDESFDSKRKYTTDSDHGDDESEASGREKAPRRSGGKKNKKFKDRNSDAESRGEAESHGEADLRGEAGEETSARRRNVRLRFLDEERESREAGLFEAMRRDGLLQFFDQPASTPVPQFVRALRNGMDEGFDPLDGLDVPDSEEEVVEDEEEVEETDDTPTYATLMREKIRELPLPNSVKLYLNFNRAL